MSDKGDYACEKGDHACGKGNYACEKGDHGYGKGDHAYGKSGHACVRGGHVCAGGAAPGSPVDTFAAVAPKSSAGSRCIRLRGRVLSSHAGGRGLT